MEQYKFSELTYQPNDFEKVNQKLNELTQRVINAANEEEVFTALEEYDSMMDEVAYAFNLAYIRSSLDCTDTFYQDAVQKEGAGYAEYRPIL